MSSILAAVRGAFAAADDTDLPEPGASGADAPSTPKGNTAMDGISQADHDAAVAAAEGKGHAAGTTAAAERFSAALCADGIKGDGVRMSAALDLATKSPAMSAADVSAFVLANVSPAKAAGTDAAKYDEERLAAAAGQAAPGARSTDPKADAVSRIVANHRLATGTAAKG